MRILLTADTVGGVWDYAATLAGELRRRHHSLMLAVVGVPEEQRLAALPDGVEVEWRDVRLEWMPGGISDVGPAGDWLRDLAGRWSADVVHLNQLAYTARRFPAPTVVVAHSDVLSWYAETLGAAAPPEWAGYARAVEAGLRGADVLISPSRYQSDLTRRHYGRGADRVIHNAAPAPAAPPPPRDEPLVIGVGRAWDDAKGMRTLDEAIGLLGADAPPARIFGAVTGPHGERFVPRHARAEGPVPRARIDDAMRRATLFAGTSLYEPFGLAPLEAALHGCALLLSDIPSFRELWDGCALFFPKGDARGLADAIRSAQADPGLRARLAVAAGERARSRYTVERLGAEYETVYRELAGSRPPAPPPADETAAAAWPAPLARALPASGSPPQDPFVPSSPRLRSAVRGR